MEFPLSHIFIEALITKMISLKLGGVFLLWLAISDNTNSLMCGLYYYYYYYY